MKLDLKKTRNFFWLLMGNIGKPICWGFWRRFRYPCISYCNEINHWNSGSGVPSPYPAMQVWCRREVYDYSRCGSHFGLYDSGWRGVLRVGYFLRMWYFDPVFFVYIDDKFVGSFRMYSSAANRCIVGRRCCIKVAYPNGTSYGFAPLVWLEEFTI